MAEGPRLSRPAGEQRVDVAVVRAPPALPQRLVFKVERALFSVRFDDTVVAQQSSGSCYWMFCPRQLEVAVLALFTRPVADAAPGITCIQCPAVPHRVYSDDGMTHAFGSMS